MSNHHLRNKDLSLKAKGLLSQMLSLPEDWDFTLKGLSLIKGSRSTRSGRYLIYEQPQPAPDSPTLENPMLEKPILEKPTQGNPMQLNKDRSKKNH